MLINCLWTYYPECHSCAKALFNVGCLYWESVDREELRLQANTSRLLKYFPVLVLWKYFPVLVLWKLRLLEIRDFGLYRHSNSLSITEARLRLAFSKALGIGNAGQVLSLVFELLRRIL